MRTPTMIAIGGAVVLAVAWVLLARTVPEPKPAPAPVVVAPPVPAAPAEPPPPASTPAPAPEPANVEPPPAAPPPAPPPEPQATPQAEAPEADDAGADDQEGPPPLDANQAADLLADWLARQEAEGKDDANKSDPVLGRFDGEKAEGDPDWSQQAKQKIEATLGEWLANLPDAIHDHLQLISVECRETLCQILAADNDPDTQAARGEHAQEWQQAVALLPQQPWWGELGFGEMRTSLVADDEHGYLLYQTYAMRAAPPPDAAPDAPPEPPPESP